MTRITNPNWLRWSLQLRIRPAHLLELWMMYREYHDFDAAYRPTIWQFLADQRRAVKIMQGIQRAAGRLREVEHVEHAADTD